METPSFTQSLARCALFYLPGLSPSFAQAPAAEPLRDARLKPQLLANKRYTMPNSSAAKVPVQSLIHIHTSNDIERLRAELIKQIWPDGYPSSTETVTASSPAFWKG
jgi:hypothetical protein